MNSNQTNFAFVHIEKAAGTTLIHEIRKAFLFQYADVRPLSRRESWHLSSDDLKKYQRFIPHLKFVGGHSVVPWSDLERALPNLQYVTILREPIDRLIAHYVHWCQRRAYNGSILDFARLPDMQNFSCKKISGVGEFDASKRMLLEKFSAVGTMENISHFFRILSETIPEFHNIEHSTVKNKRWKDFNDRLDSNTYDELRELNRDDLFLYAWVKDQYNFNHEENHNDMKSDLIIQNTRNSNKFSQFIDYIWRKSWVEPISGVIRVANCLPYKGSYQFQ